MQEGVKQAMYNYSPTLWSIWPALSTLNHLFVVILIAVVFYSLISAIVVMKRLPAVASHESSGTTDSLRPHFASLAVRCTNLRQILGATFYLFGFLFFIGLQNAFITVGDGPQLPFVEVVSNFVVQFVFAANVFLIFLILHLVQWMISSRLEACARRLVG